MVTVSSIYSTLGNNSSLVPLAIKDVANSCGLTAASYMAGDKSEGKDRFIDEFGTQAIWLWGIPAYKKVIDFAIKHIANIDPEIDVRVLKNQEIAKMAKEFAPNSNISQSLERAISKQKLTKGLSITKFIVSTALTSLTYLGLTKFRHKYTEEQIKRDYYERQKRELEKNKNLNFKGGVQDFMFDPVKNLMLVDASITGERLTHARNPQDFLGYVIKEGSFWAFMYFAGERIQHIIEKNATKKGHSIDLDARVLENEEFKNSFKSGEVKKAIDDFAKNEKLDSSLYQYIVNNKDNNLIVKIAKTSDKLSIYQNDKSFFAKLSGLFKSSNDTKNLKTGIVDTRKYVDLEDIKYTKEKVARLYNEYKKSGEDLDVFFNKIRKGKRASILKNMGACITALGIIAPAIMLISRKMSANSDYQVKKDIEKQLDAGVIV